MCQWVIPMLHISGVMRGTASVDWCVELWNSPLCQHNNQSLHFLPYKNITRVPQHIAHWVLDCSHFLLHLMQSLYHFWNNTIQKRHLLDQLWGAQSSTNKANTSRYIWFAIRQDHLHLAILAWHKCCQTRHSPEVGWLSLCSVLEHCG